MQEFKYRLKRSDSIAELIRKLHPNIKKKIKASLQAILTDPDTGKALKDELSGLRSFRTGRFRIIYKTLPKKEIVIIAIGPRETIYEETLVLSKKHGELQ